MATEEKQQSEESKAPPDAATLLAGFQAMLQQTPPATSTRNLIGSLPDEFATGIAPSPTALQAQVSGVKKGTISEFAAPKGKAQYYQGDEVALFQGLRTADIKRLQDRLVTAGYLEGQFRYGDIGDVETRQALTGLLTSANIAGEDYETTLTFAENSGMWYDSETGTFSKGKRPSGRLPVQLSDPTKLSDVLQQVAGSQLGRRLSDQEVQQFVSKFHGIEQGNDANNIDAPDIELYADQYAQQADPTAYEGQSMVNVFQEAMKVIGSGIETAPAAPTEAAKITAPGLGGA